MNELIEKIKGNISNVKEKFIFSYGVKFLEELSKENESSYYSIGKKYGEVLSGESTSTNKKFVDVFSSYDKFTYKGIPFVNYYFPKSVIKSMKIKYVKPSTLDTVFYNALMHDFLIFDDYFDGYKPFKDFFYYTYSPIILFRLKEFGGNIYFLVPSFQQADLINYLVHDLLIGFSKIFKKLDYLGFNVLNVYKSYMHYEAIKIKKEYIDFPIADIRIFKLLHSIYKKSKNITIHSDKKDFILSELKEGISNMTINSEAKTDYYYSFLAEVILDPQNTETSNIVNIDNSEYLSGKNKNEKNNQGDNFIGPLIKNKKALKKFLKSFGIKDEKFFIFYYNYVISKLNISENYIKSSFYRESIIHLNLVLGLSYKNKEEDELITKYIRLFNNLKCIITEKQRNKYAKKEKLLFDKLINDENH